MWRAGHRGKVAPLRSSSVWGFYWRSGLFAALVLAG